MKKIFFLANFIILTLFIGCNNRSDGKKIDNDACIDFNCGEHGVCIISENSEPICSCESGYNYIPNQGCINLCENEKCTPYGSCSIENSVAFCNCNEGYHSINLECVENIDLCKNIICDGGSCNQTTGKCECPIGYHLINETQCKLIEGCNPLFINCGEHGVCVDDIEKDFWCKCDDGYYYNGTTCVIDQICLNGKTPCSGAITGCCNSDEICLNDTICKTIPITDCQNDNECEVNQFCDPTAEKCIDIDDESGCVFIPPYNEILTPLIGWEWPGTQIINTPDYKYVMMAPMVANISDDNGDGFVNLRDTPDVIFSTFKGSNYNADGVIRVVDGKTGIEIANTALLSRVVPGWELAIGDIDNDGFNEIIGFKDVSGSSGPHPLIAFRYNISTGLMEEVWTVNSTSGAKAAAIADLDHDGKPEVIAQNHIINGEDGSIFCSFSGGTSNMPIVEDVNSDGFMDIISGSKIYSGEDCSLITDPNNGGATGYVAMADLDFDDIPEIVTVSNNTINIYNLSLIPKIEPFVIGDPTRAGGGPPTIANFDQNIQDLEIAVAGEDYYSVTKVDFNAIEPNPKAWFLWKKLTEDHSSKSTGSSLFDFEGDGINEVLYADQCYFRVYNGEDGSERFKTINSNGTLNEYPIVVDVDNDGKSEIVVGSNNYGSHPECDWWGTNPGQNKVGTNGIRVFESPDNSWVRTRRIWNQHTYHVTNINEDGSIPQYEEHNWETYNNYRLNIQGKGVFNAPNFIIERVQIEREDCPQLLFKIEIRVANIGSLSVNSGIPVAIYKGFANEGNSELIGVITTTETLFPGSRETLYFNYTPQNPEGVRQFNIYLSADDYGNGIGEYSECNESDNIMETSFKGSYELLCSIGVGQCMRFAPYICNENDELICGAIAGTPQTEVCGDGLDNNCDGETDENCGCNSGETQECYRGYADSFGENSRCKKGTQSCIGGELWTSCENDILPIVELCNGVDDDCDGIIDNGFQMNESCFIGIGACRREGIYKCDENGNQICDAVVGEPEYEICGDSVDNDCDSLVDERPCRE
ncbi:VCBS repeat-containing protein [bacterium]|nr:VCBS repeat-containing protein [bacterium]